MIRHPKVMRLLAIRPQTIVHVGAHHAQDDDNYREWGASKIIWFEGDESNVSWIRKYRPNVDVRHAAMWHSANQQVIFHYHADSSQSSINSPSLQEVTKGVKINSTTIDAQLEKESLEDPILLVIDVQGSEIEVLRGACSTLSRAKYVICELTIHNNRYQNMPKPIEIEELLAGSGFKMSIFRNSHDDSYKDQVFIKAPQLQIFVVRCLDILFHSALVLRHLILHRHLRWDYLKCQNCTKEIR